MRFLQRNISLLILLSLVVVVTVDGVYIAYDGSSDVTIITSVNGTDAAMQEVAGISGQIITIILGLLRIVDRLFTFA